MERKVTNVVSWHWQSKWSSYVMQVKWSPLIVILLIINRTYSHNGGTCIISTPPSLLFKFYFFSLVPPSWVLWGLANRRSYCSFLVHLLGLMLVAHATESHFLAPFLNDTYYRIKLYLPTLAEKCSPPWCQCDTQSNPDISNPRKTNYCVHGTAVKSPWKFL